MRGRFIKVLLGLYKFAFILSPLTGGLHLVEAGVFLPV